MHCVMELSKMDVKCFRAEIGLESWRRMRKRKRRKRRRKGDKVCRAPLI